MAGYVIHGGGEGKARLHVISAALAPSTTAILDRAGVSEKRYCLDLGCGGGDVSLLLARMVAPSGRVVGIDMDDVKIDLARADAADQGVGNVEFQVGDASAIASGEDRFDLIYVRLLLTHLSQPETVLARLVDLLAPDGSVVIEDMDHSAVFAYPSCPALERYLRVYDQAARHRGGDPDIGPKLPGMLRRAGFDVAELRVVQPVFMRGEAKRIHQITLENIRETVLAAGLATSDELDTIAADLEGFVDDPDTMLAFPRIFQTIALLEPGMDRVRDQPIPSHVRAG